MKTSNLRLLPFNRCRIDQPIVYWNCLPQWTKNCTWSPFYSPLSFMFSFSNTNMLCLDCRQFMFLWLEQKKEEKKSRCSLSHCWTLSLLSSFQLFLQHMAFFDTASDKTKQIGMPQLSALQSHLFCTWTSVKACKCKRQRDALFHARPPPPSFDKTRKVFVLNRVLHVSDVLRDGRTAKIHPVLSAKVTGIKFLMSNIISIQSSYFSIYVTPLFFLPLESVQSCS